MNVSRRREGYSRELALIDFLARAYEGGEAYRDGEFLDRYPREEPDIYRARLSRAYYPNYTAPVVDTYVAEVFRVEPAREVPQGPLASFTEAATRDGTSLNDFMRISLASCLATGHRYIGVDIDEDGAPYLHAIHPANVLDFSEDAEGFLWMLLAEERVIDEDPEENRRREVLFRLWTRQEWRLFSRSGEEIDGGENPAGVVPVLYMPGREVRLPIEDIAEMNRRIYNIASQRDEILMKLTFPQFYVQDALDESTMQEERAVEIGTGRVLVLPPGTSIAPGFLAPPDGPVEQHRKEQEYLVGEIYRLAGLQRRDPDEIRPQSGVAKAYDFRETNARLAAAAHLCERVEREIFSLLSAYGLAADGVNVTYQKDFRVESFSDMLESYLAIASSPLPAYVKRLVAKDLAARITEERTPEERRAAQEAVDAMPDAQLSGEGGGQGAPSVIDRILSEQ